MRRCLRRGTALIWCPSPVNVSTSSRLRRRNSLKWGSISALTSWTPCKGYWISMTSPSFVALWCIRRGTQGLSEPYRRTCHWGLYAAAGRLCVGFRPSTQMRYRQVHMTTRPFLSKAWYRRWWRQLRDRTLGAPLWTWFDAQNLSCWF